MLSPELLADLDISPENILKPETLVALRNAYEETVKSAKASAEKSESALKQASDELAKDETLVKTHEELLSALREVILPFVDSDPRIAVLLFDGLQTIKDEVKFDREYYLKTGHSFKGVTKPVTSEEYDEKRQTAETISEAITSVWSLLGKPQNIEGFPVKETTYKKGPNAGEKTGNFVPELSNLPAKRDEDSSSGGLVGRAAAQATWRFAWTPTKGERIELPAGTRGVDVAYKYVSDRANGVIITIGAISDAVKASGKYMGGKEKWSVKFPTGKLEGWVVKE